MKQTLPHAFEDCVTNIQGRTVLLDVDGTLLPDDANQIEDAVINAVAQLRRENTVYLVSNGRDALRVKRLARELMVDTAPAGVPAGKPFIRAARGIPHTHPFLVIGDKFIVDGLFARFLKVPFIKVRSKRSGAERSSVRLSYMLENIVSLFV